MKTKIVFFLSFFIFSFTFSQSSLKQLLKKYNTESVPYITAEELSKEKSDYILLDARESKEYDVSSIKNGIFVGYQNFDLKRTTDVILANKKDAKIVVYCSLGVRSEDIAEQLKKKGFTNVFNLYGGIFEWKNKGFTVINTNNKPTEKVHAFDKEWGKWLKKGIKVYE
ncbi:conserved protein of unknown function [Tenacibaculum jejuense]|uniref:Rhodanese domain-containing protein n=1 Tax=Tenacibaculum jejuense TaxID=584609 RepID=A0A238UEE8_9FLAO|nr:conserved protein of unknown function [Tenacibaculum jejuense]